MPVNIDQSTMDKLNQFKSQTTNNLSDAQNQSTSAQQKVNNLQTQLNSINAIIADCVVVP